MCMLGDFHKGQKWPLAQKPPEMTMAFRLSGVYKCWSIAMDWQYSGKQIDQQWLAESHLLATSQWPINEHQVKNAALNTNNQQIAINQQMCFSETQEPKEHFCDRNLSIYPAEDTREWKVLITHEC